MALDWASWDQAHGAALESNSDRDWNHVDRQMLRLCQQCGVSIGDLRCLIGKVIVRLGYDPEGDPVHGDPTDTYIPTALATVYKKLEKTQSLHNLCSNHLIMHRTNAVDAAKLVSVSDGWCHLFGYEPEEVLGRSSYDLLTDESRQRVISTIYPNFLKTGLIENVQVGVLSKTGKVVPVRVSAVAERDVNHDVVRGISIISPEW